MTDRVLVTGISGFLGGHVALHLLAEGYTVRGSVRSLSRAEKVRTTLAANGADISRLEIVALDLSSDTGWSEAMAGVRYLQHVASPFVIEQPRDKQELIRPAVEGTRRAITAALTAGVERIVLTSSIAAIVYGHTDYSKTFTTADWTDPDSPRTSAYPESKLRAEREAWSIVESFGARERLSTINPAAILGPLLDDDPGTSGALIQRLLNGSVPAAPRMTFSIVDVRDVAAAQLAAMTSPEAAGHRHILAEREMSVFELAQALRPHFPQLASRFPRFELPDWVVRAVGLFDPQIRTNTQELGNIRRVDGSAGRALLGRPLIPATDAALATARSLIAHGLVR
jgi:dihydroflavonol-4-reductase